MSVTIDHDPTKRPLIYCCDECGAQVRTSPDDRKLALTAWTVVDDFGGPHHYCSTCRPRLGHLVNTPAESTLLRLVAENG